MIQIAICDDSPYELDKISKLTQSYLKQKKQEYVITQFFSLRDLQDQMLISKFEILLLDVKFKEEKTTSLDFAQQLANIAPQIQIIFITGYLSYFPEVYLCNHIYCILKEDLEKHLPRAMDKALKLLNNRLKSNQENVIHITMNRHVKIIPVNDILYLEKRFREIYFKCQNIQNYLTPDEIKTLNELFVTTYGSFNNYLPLLPNSFVQNHRSYITNLDYVKSVQHDALYLLNGDIIPISRNYKKQTMQRIAELYFHE